MPSDWERVAADPALLAALRRRYTGSGDPLDVLWWREHPGEPTPAGIPDPSDAIETARRALFRPAASPTAAGEVERASAAAAEALRSARRALAAADAEMRSRPASSTGHGTRRVLAGPVVAALLIGAGAGFIAGRFTGHATPPAFAVFDRAQLADDRPPSVAALPDAVTPGSTRLLGTSSSSGTSMYAARTTGGRVCMLAVVLARYAAGTCTTDAAFAEAGLSLTFPTTVDPQDDSGPAAVQELTALWSPAGRLTF